MLKLGIIILLWIWEMGIKCKKNKTKNILKKQWMYLGNAYHPGQRNLYAFEEYVSYF